MKRIKAAALLGMCMAVFTACRGKADVNSVSELEQGIQAVEEAVNAGYKEQPGSPRRDISRHRGHTGGFPNGVRLWKRPYQRLVQRGYA